MGMSQITFISDTKTMLMDHKDGQETVRSPEMIASGWERHF